MSIHEIRILMEEGKNDQALVKIEMSKENELDLKLLKSMVFRAQELFAIALSEAEGALKASREARGASRSTGSSHGAQGLRQRQGFGDTG